VSGVGVRVVRYEPEGVPRGRSVVVVLVDPARFDPDGGFGRLQYIRGQGDDRSGHASLARGGEVLAANTIRDRFGVGVGDVARLRTDEGFRDLRSAASSSTTPAAARPSWRRSPTWSASAAAVPTSSS
jgi:hypothetical protein